MKIYGVVGYPCKHSMSPLVHNAGFKALGIDAEYRIFETDDLPTFMKEYKNGGIAGLSVTMPYKNSIIEYLSNVDDAVRKIGACNCVNSLSGFNTDCDGAVLALKNVTGISGKKVYLLGTGGAASAIFYGLTRENAKISVFNRDLMESERFVKNFNQPVKLLSELDGNYDILINATACGFKSNESCVPKSLLVADKVVMDIVYEPLKTALLKDAGAAGCVTVSGENMLLYQAAKAFEIWTGKAAPIESMQEAIYSFLKKDAPSSSGASSSS